MSTLHLRLLGGFEARVGDAALSVGSRKARALLAYLALAGPRLVRRETVATLLWGRTAQRQALSSLNQALYVLRKELDAAACPALRGDAEAIGLDPGLIASDVAAFARQAEAVEPSAWRTALALYRGPLLDGLVVDEPGFETWLAAERMRLSDLAAATGARLLDAAADDPAADDPTPIARTLLAIDPLDEAAIRALMRLDARGGRTTRALARFEALRRSLAAELDAAPAAATRTLAEALRRGEIAPRSPPAPIPAGRPPARRAGARTAIVAAACAAVLAGVLAVLLAGATERDETPAATRRLLVAPIAAEDLRLSGLGADIATELARLRSLAVLARETARTRDAWPPSAARAVGATHVLAGSIRQDTTGATLTMRLVDAEAGVEAWARRYALDEDGLLTLRERVIDDVVEALAVALAPQVAPPTRDLAAYESYLDGLTRFHEGTPEGNAAAVAHLAAALDRDPGFAPARAMLAAAYLRAADGAAAYADALGLHWSEGWLLAKAQLAALEDVRDPTALAQEAQLALGRHDLDEAVARASEAIAMAPSHAQAHRTLAEAAAFRGDGATARAAAHRALALDPAQPAGAWRALALAAFTQGALEEARDLAARAIDGGVAQVESLALLAAVEALLGDTATARARLSAYAAAREDRPRRLWRVADPAGGNPRGLTWARPTLAGTLARHPFADPTAARRLARGLAAAGIAAASVGHAPFDPAARLDGPALRALFLDATILGTPAEGDPRGWRETRGGGHPSVLVSDRAPAPAARASASVVRDDRLCDLFTFDGREIARCATVYAVTGDAVVPGTHLLKDELGLHFVARAAP